MEYGNLSLGFPGLKKGVGNARVTTRAAGAIIPFGHPVFVQKGNDNQCFPTQVSALTGVPAEFEVTITGTTDATATGTITINGLPYTSASIPSGSNATAVAAALAAAVVADPAFTATASGAVITLVAVEDGFAYNAATIVAAPPSGATAATVRTVGGVNEAGPARFLGAALSSAQEGAFEYQATDPVNIMTGGILLVTAQTYVDSGDEAYATDAGFTPTPGATDPVGVFRTSAASGDLVELELNQPGTV